MPQPNCHTIPFRPVPIFPINACKHYRDDRLELETIDDILIRSGLDDFMLNQALKHRAQVKTDDKSFHKGLEKFIQYARSSFRIPILQALSNQKSVREMEISLGSNTLEQWFCFIENFAQIKSPSKSTIDRAKNFFTPKDHEAAFSMLLQKAASSPENYDPVIAEAINLLGFEIPTNLVEVWYDGTCITPNIHFPVDWVQLGDCCRTLLKATKTIRKHGIKNRIPKGDIDPLLSQLNQLLIALGNARRRKDSKKQRKKILRKLKKFAKRSQHHAEAHKALLHEQREEKTTLTEAQANLIIQRIDNVLSQLPQAIKQAHDRIIGERRIPTADKILSIYEPDINVMVRGKSGAEVEYGNQLIIGENREGLITYFKLHEDVKIDSNRLLDALTETQKNINAELELVVGDRGFSDLEKDTEIKETYSKLINHIYPKAKPPEGRDPRTSPDFKDSQKRRSQTEARIGILTNNYQRGRTLSKGLSSQRMELNWIMLGHNLRTLARRRIEEEAARRKAQEQRNGFKKAS
jgi:ferritin-like protein